MGKIRFRKAERLNKKKLIEALFEKGASFSVYPLKVIFTVQPVDITPLHQVLITVPSKNFKRAVDRNTVKRRIREGYRLNKALFKTSSAFCIAYIYIAKEVLPSPVIHKAIQSSFERLSIHEKKS